MTCILPIVLLLVPAQDTPPKPGESSTVEAKRVDAVVVPQGKMARLQIKTGKFIAKAHNLDEKVIRVGGLAARSVVVEALTEGIAHLTLMDVDGKDDTVIVIVEKEGK
jgi:putative intracellular protease/amidase